MENDAIQVQLAHIKAELKQMKQMIKELHAVQTGELLKLMNKESKPVKLTAKQKKKIEADEEMAYLETLRSEAHRKMLNLPEKKKPRKTKKQLQEDEIAAMCRLAEIRTMNR
jgi:hypothetical protein